MNELDSVPCSAGNRVILTRRSRMKYGLDLPYGPAAKALGLAETDEPPRRETVKDRKWLKEAQKAADAAANGEEVSDQISDELDAEEVGGETA